MKNKHWTESAVAIEYPITVEEEVVVNYVYIADFIHLATLALFFLGFIHFLYRDTQMFKHCFYTGVFMISIAKAIRNRRLNKITYKQEETKMNNFNKEIALDKEMEQNR